MIWQHIGEGLKHFKVKITFRHLHEGKAVQPNELIRVRASGKEASMDPRTLARLAEDRYQRSEFSQHISS